MAPYKKPVTRRDFCRTTLASLGALATTRAHAGTRRPNILFITSDDMGPYLGCYNDPCARTPHLDRLASEGALFERAYVAQASCSPSRSAMFTGLFPHQNGQIGLAHLGYSMHPGQKTLPALLKAAGYRTGVLGKIHVAPDGPLPFDLRKPGYAFGSREVMKAAARAGQFFEAAGEEPFFLMLNFFDPHRPYEGKNQVAGIPEQPQGPDDVRPFPFLGLDAPEVREEVAAYYNCTARVDAGVGETLRRLEASGKADNTLVVFIGDHGPPFTRGKTTCYESGVRIPFLARWPGRVPAGVRRNALVSTVDLLPTMLDAAGVEPPACEGRSILPVCEDADAPWRACLHTEFNSHGPWHWFPRRAVRNARYKLILNLLAGRENPVRGVDDCKAWPVSQRPEYEGTRIREAYDRYHQPPRIEFYDLEADPAEFHNLAGEPAHEIEQQRLLMDLAAWRKKTKDPLLDPETLAEMTRKHDALVGERPHWPG